MRVTAVLGLQHSCTTRRRRMRRLVRAVGVVVVVLVLLVWVVVPICFRLSSDVQNFFVFLNVGLSEENLKSPEALGLPGTRNFYLTTDEEVTVGIWHVLPDSLKEEWEGLGEQERVLWTERQLGSGGRPIILFLHGNKCTRSQDHRIDMYISLRHLNYHVITFDYRGFADSSSMVPTEEGLVQDTKVIYKYLLSHAAHAPIFVWGHSLGSGVACRAVAELCREGQCPAGLILEAAFNNLADEVKANPLSVIFRWLPYFEWAFVAPLHEAGIKFESDVHIVHISSPILMLHAQDDHVVPIELGRKLQRAGELGRPLEAPPIQFMEFEAALGYTHNYISKDPSFKSIVKNFVDFSRQSEMKDIS